MHLFFKGPAIQSGFNLPVFVFSCLIFLSSGFSIAQPLVAQAPQSASVKLAEDKLKAQGRQQTILNISHFGRYAILANSEQGTAVQYIDRMAGPSAIMGYSGETNGRIDTFLDKGDYKIITLSHDKGEGEVELRVVASRELNSTPVQLIDYKLIESELGDFQQRSYWIELKHRKTLILEAAGRSLADLRIWKDGNWLVADKPVAELIEPSPGKPLLAQRMIVDLNPGLYLLSAYGGPAQPWAETSTASPFYLRMGIPPVAQSGRTGRVISPFGIDRWRVPAQSDYYRLELEASAAAVLTVGSFEESYAFDAYDDQRYIDKKSLVPVAEIKTYTRDTGFKLVSVQAQAGKPYILQHFLMSKYRQLDPGRYWVSTLHSGHASDSVDVTAMMTKWRNSDESLLYNTALKLDLTTGWKRRFNLLDPLTLFFEVKQSGTYFVNGEGVNAEYRFEPFLSNQQRNYRAADFKSLGQTTDLDKGFYKLSVRPREGRQGNTKGIITLTVSPKNANARLESVAQTSARFNEVSVGRKSYINIYLNEQPGVTSGIYTRSLPIDLNESLPVTQKAGESLSIPVTIPGEGELSARTENGSLLNFTLKKEESFVLDVLNLNKKRLNVDAGKYLFELENKTDKPISYQLSFTKKRELQSTPLPTLSAARLSRIPKLAVLDASAEQFLDLGHQQKQSYNVKVKSPSLYRLETSGLLQTAGTIRTRVSTSLDSQSNNGVGRNFLIQQFLRQGDYQLSVSTQGQTKGHLGLKLSKTQLLQGGQLIEDIPARFTLQPGAGLVYGFKIKKPGAYNIQSYGLNGKASVRLEDAQGWPLVKPGIEGDINYSFAAGSYRLVVLPMALESRVISVFNKTDQQPVKSQGRGPFELALNQRVAHQWLEPQLNEDRPNEDQANEDQPNEAQKTDDWFFDLPADSELSISLSQSMQGRLYRREKNNEIKQIFELSDKKPFRSELLKGRYLLKVSNKKKNNFFDYTVSTSTREVLPGQSRVVYAPQDVPISIGETALVEISSAGYQDVKASLYDSAGKRIAANDDRAHDWNFDLVENLARGKYTLKVQAVGSSDGETTVSVFIAKTTLEPSTRLSTGLPASMQFSDAQIHIYPFELSAPGIVAVAAQSAGSVGISLEMQTEEGWISVGSENGENPVFAIVADGVADGGAKQQPVHYRLKAWSPERREMPIKLQLKLLEVSRVSEGQLASGTSADKTALLSHKVSAIKVKLEKPGVFKSKRAGQQVFWARENQQQLQPARYEFSSGKSSEMWLFSVDEPDKIAASRLDLHKGQQSLMIDYGAEMGAQMWLDAQSRAGVMDLFVANSRVGLPGIGLTASAKAPGVPDTVLATLLAMGVGLQSTAIVTPGVASTAQNWRLKLWNNHQHIAQLPVTISQFSFTDITEQALQAGINDIFIKPVQVVKAPLPEGQKEINFTLPQGVAAAFLTGAVSGDGDVPEDVPGDVVEQVLWSDTQDNAHEISTAANSVVFYNTQKNSVYPLSMSVQPLADNRDANVVTHKNILRRHFAASGYFHFSVKLTEAEKLSGVSLHSYGQHLNLVAVDKKGNISSGSQLTLYDDAQVSMRHSEGLHVLWLAQPYRGATPGDARAGDARAGDAQAVQLNDENLSKSINRPLKKSVEVLRFNLQQAGLFNLSTKSPVILRKGVPGSDESLLVYETAMRDSVFLPAGESYLEFESINGQPLHDTLYLHKAQLSVLKEGLGEALSLYPGQARLYSFDLESEPNVAHQIGVGVKASIDIAQCTLYNAQAQVLGRGVTQKHRLQAGRYYLAVNLPVDTPSMVSVQPALVGLNKPSQGPPQAVMLEYQQLISQKTQ